MLEEKKCFMQEKACTVMMKASVSGWEILSVLCSADMMYCHGTPSSTT